MTGQQRAMPAAWFNEADYPEILRITVDDSLQPTWDAWLKDAEKQVAKFESLGGKVLKVIVDPKDFAAWCARRGAKVDAAARILYAASHSGM